MTADWRDALAPWRGVRLEDLDDAKSLQTRTDRKYIVSGMTLEAALARLTPAAVLEVDGEREQRYSSTYFDTPDLTAYLAAARRRPRRFKVRTRSYLDTDRHAIELKLRAGTGTTVKHRAWLADDAADTLGGQARRFLEDFPMVADALDALAPALTTTYRRTTLVTPNGRVTIDSDVTASVGEASISFAPQLIVETKSLRHAGEMDHALWYIGARPTRVSKYCTSRAALDPSLPSTRWSRTLRRHLDVPSAAAFAA
jgi:hypothetical protein